MRTVFAGTLFLLSNGLWTAYLFAVWKCFVGHYARGTSTAHNLRGRMLTGFWIHFVLSLVNAWFLATWEMPYGEPAWIDRFALALPRASLLFGVFFNTVLIFTLNENRKISGWRSIPRTPLQVISITVALFSVVCAFGEIRAAARASEFSSDDLKLAALLIEYFLISVWLLFKQACRWSVQFQPDPNADRFRRYPTAVSGVLAIVAGPLFIMSIPNF